MNTGILLFVIFDIVANRAIGQPFSYASEGPALRLFSDLCRNAESPIGQHPADYELHCIGAFDDATLFVQGSDKPKYDENGVMIGVERVFPRVVLKGQAVVELVKVA